MENNDNVFSNTPDSVFSYLAQSYNKPGNTGNFRAQQAASGQSEYGASPLFTQEQIDAGRTSQHLTNPEYYETLASSVKTDYNPTSGEVIFQAPKSIAETRQWKDFVTSINNTFRGQPLEQAINYMDTDEYKEAAATALSNAVTSVMQRDSLNASLGQEINQQETDIFGASSTLSDGSGGIRGGAYMYVPEVQPDGTVKYVQKSADEALKAKNIANILPGFIYNQKEYIDSTQGEYTATGTAVGLAAGSKLGPIGALVGAGIGGTAGFLMGDSEGKMDSRFAEVQKIVNEKGDTSLMDLSQDEKAEVYAAVSEAIGRLQSWADKGIALSDDMKQYYVNLVGFQSSLDDLGFSHMSDLTNAKNWVENFVRQRANNLFGGSTLLSLVGGVEGAASGRGFGNGFLETQEALTTTGLDTYASPAEQLFAKRNEDGTIGDTGFLGLAADVGLGLLLDPAGSVASKTAQWANNGLRRTVNGIASVIDDGGISILAAGMGKVGRGIGGKIRSAAQSRLGKEAVSGASAGAHNAIKKVAREVAEGAETKVDEGLDKAIDSMADSISDSGSDAVKRTIADAAQEGEEQLAGDLENIGRNMTKEEIERAAGEATTDGINLSDKLQTFAKRVFDGAVDNIAKGIVKTYDAMTVSGNLGKISELVSQLTGKGAKELSQETRDQLISQYRRLVARGAVADAVRQIARQMPLNAVVALGNTAIEAQTARSLGQDYDKDDYLNTLLGNFGMAMLTSAAPAGLRTGSRLLDAMTDGGVTKLKQKASRFAAKIATIPPTIARNAPGISTLRQKTQKLANPNAKQLNELRYQNHRAFAQGDIDYDTWMNNQALLSDAQFSTSTLNLIHDLDAKGLFTADRDVMNMLGGVTKSGRPKVLGGNYDKARQLVNDFINYDNMARRLKHPRNPDESKDTALSKKRKAKSDEYIKIRDEALDEMHRIIEENGGDIDEFDRALFGTSLDAEVDTSAGPIRADANDQSLMGRLRHFYDVRSQMMADEGLTSQTALDALRTNPSYAGTYIRFAYSDGASVDEIAENLAQFYTVTAKPKTSKLVQTVKDELGMAEGKTAAGPVETAVMSINDVSDAILANQRNRVAVQLSDALGDSDLDFCRQATDPDVVTQGEQEINEYTEFRQRAGDAFADVITVTEYETTGEEGGPRTDRDTNNLNEYHTRLTNDPYIQKRAQETGIPPEALARSYMADNVSSMVSTYRKQEMHRYGDKKAKQLAGAYRKKVNSWLSGEDLSQQDVRQRREFKAEMAKQRNAMSKLSDDALIRMGNSIKSTPVQQAMARQELARRRSVNHGARQVSVPVAKEGDTTQYLDKLAKEKFEADSQNRERTNQQLGRTQLPESGDAQLSIADAPRQQRSQSTQMLRPAEELGQQTDALGYTYTEAEVPVADLIAGRSREFQPRVTASGEGTRRSVRERGYQEGMVDQPLVVWKDGDAYKVLGGHSRTMGLEDRAKAGLDNPENVRARVYTDITEAQAKQISRRANQGGQYESDLDMAKSIAESQRAGEEPQVQKNNMARYTTYDDYAFAWDAIEHDSVMQQVVNSSETFNTKAFIAGAKKARKLGLTPQEYMRTVKSLYANGRLTTTNVDIVTRQVTTRRKNKAAKEAQGMLFDDDLGVAVDSLDILNEHAALSRQLKSQQNALKKVTKIGGMSESFIKEANNAIDTIKAKMDDIDNELIRRYNARQQARNVAEGKATARIAEDGRSIEVTVRGTENDEEPETYLVSTDQANLFGGTIADDVAMSSFNGTPQDFVDQTAEATKDQLETQVDSNQGSLFAEQDVPQQPRQETTGQEAEPEAAEPETAESTTAKEWYDAFVREHDAPPTIDDYKARIQDEMDGTAPAALTNVMDLTMYHQIKMAQDQRGIVLDNYVQQHARALHLGKSYDMATVKKTMSYVPENAIKLAENNVKAPTLAQCKSAALYTGQLGSKELSPDVIRGLEAIAEKQTVSSQRQAMNSFMADDSVADVNGVFYSKLSDENKKRFMDNLEARTKDAVASVNGRLVIPDNLAGSDRAAFLGKQLQRARLVQEIQTNPQKYSKKEFSIARDDDGNPIPGSAKYLTSPERLVIRSKPTNRFDTFNKFNQGVYKTLDQRNSHFNPTDEVYIGTGQVLAANDSEALSKIVRSMKRTFTDPATRQQISTFESRLSKLTRNSLDDLPLVQELLNSVYGVDALRFTGKQGDTVLVFDGSSAKNGGIWEEKTTFDQIDSQTLHDFDTTADLWKDSVKSKQSDTKQRIAEEKKAEKAAQRKPNFTVYEKGKKYVYEITNPTVAETFQTVSLSTSKTAFDVIGKFFQRTQRLFRVMTTGSGNPAYLMTNYVRDLQTSAITGGMNAILPKFSDDIYSSIFEVVGIPTADADAIADRLRNGYSGSAYNLSQSQSILRRSPQEQRKILTKTARQIAGVKSTRIPSSFEEVVDLAGKPSDAIENKRRGKLADNYYNQYIMNHMPEYLANPTEANRKKLISNATNYGIFYARNATTDFSYQPQYASQFLSFIPYARTGMASARSFGRTFLADPVGMLARIICLGIAPYTANLVSNLSDPDKAAIYSEIPEYERADNWIIVRNDGTYISIPLPQELIPFLAPSRVLVENSKDVRNSGAFMSIASGLCNYSPIDFSGFFERDINGDIDFVKGVSRVANSVIPQALSPAVEQILNRDLYTGSPLNPTVEDLVRQGAKLNKDGTLDASEMTFASRNSQTLGEIADFLNMPQGAVYNYVTNYLGTASKYVINAVDTLRGAPSDARGGQDVAEYTSQLFFNSSPGGASSAWNNGISKLYDQKDLLMETINSDTSQEEKDEIVKDFTDSVVRFCDAYSDYYSLAGGMTDKQRTQVVGLLDFYQGSNTLQTSDEALENASYDEYNAAMQRAVDAGIIPKEGLKSQLYGKMNDEGEVTFSTPAMRALTTKVYGTPEEAVYQMEQVLDSSEGGGTMKDLKSAVYDALDPYYDRIAAGEQLTDDEYNEMDAIRKSYMDEFYRRIDPIIEQYGATILNNDDIIEALNDYTITTSDDWQESLPQYSKKGKEYHKYISSKLFPNATADVQQILLEHYGMGGRDTGNLQTDKRADDLIRTLQEATANGEMGKAQDYQRLLFTGIQNGSLYVSDQDMSQLGI